MDAVGGPGGGVAARVAAAKAKAKAAAAAASGGGGSGGTASEPRAGPSGATVGGRSAGSGTGSVRSTPPAGGGGPASASAAAAAAQQANLQAAGAESGRWLCCLPCYWLRSNRSVHQASLTVAMLLVTSILVASPVLFLISSAPAGDRSKDCQHQDDEGCSRDGANSAPFTCQEQQCRQAARAMQASMDWRVDPCRDFYAFACGGWAREAGVSSLSTLQRQVDMQLQHQLSLASTVRPFQKLGVFYTSCLRVKERGRSYAPMLELLSSLGGYLPPGGPAPDLTALVARLLRFSGTPLLDVDVDSDPRNHSRLAVFLDLPQRHAPGAAGPLWQQSQIAQGLERWFEGEPPPSSKRQEPPVTKRLCRSQPKESRAYTYMKDSAEEKRLLSLERLLHVFLPKSLAKPVRAKEAQSILLFAAMLNKQFPRHKDLMGHSEHREMFQSFNITQLQEQYTFLQWQPLLEEVFARNFSEYDAVFVRAPEYMARLQGMLPHFQKRVVHNALLLLFARDSLWELVDPSVTPSGAGSAPSGGGGGRDWPAFCAHVSVTLFARAASALYVRQFSLAEIEELRDQVTQVFELLKETLSARVQRSAWLDEETRAAALTKLQQLRGHFFTWPNLWNTTYVAGLLEDVQVDPDDFFSNVIRRYQQLRKVPVDIFDSPVPERKWAYPFVVNAFYVRSINSMVIPLAVLTQPTFRGDLPRYVPYATVGLVLAHEMLHAFDLQGVAFDADGALDHWVSPSTRLKLEARLDCVARQYANAFSRKVAFLGTTVDIQFDWNATSNENMADVAALQVTHEAWRALLAAARDGADARLPKISLGPRQLFFVAAAQSYCSTLSPEEYIVLVEVDHHTPYPERINGMMMNSPAFSEAFKCPIGSPMNPGKKCATW